MANEKRLIDADVLVEAIVNTPSEVAKFHTYNVLSSLAERQHEILDLIENQSTVDAVEVIRCESCKWYEPECENCDFWGGYRNPDHYCGEGERKNEAG